MYELKTPEYEMPALAKAVQDDPTAPEYQDATVEEARAATQELLADPMLDNLVEDEAQEEARGLSDAETELDKILAAQEEPEVVETSAPFSFEEVVRGELETLRARVTALEQRIDEHNTRSGHKI